MASGLGNFMMKSVGPSRTGTASPAKQLYRAIAKEVPRILTIYDVDMDFAQVSVRAFVRVHVWPWSNASCSFSPRSGTARTHLHLDIVAEPCCTLLYTLLYKL